MYTRQFTGSRDKSFFIFGPRGTGKTTWLKRNYADAVMLDLLSSELYRRLIARPELLAQYIPDNYTGWVIIDEIQKIPDLLNEVHKLIEADGLKFILTGSSARSLRRKGVNLLAGRALNYYMYPLTSFELGADFSFEFCMQYGTMPSVFIDEDPKKYLETYIVSYVDQEVKQEGLTRRIDVFQRFLEAASFSQGALLNTSSVARDCGVNRKLAEDYFTIVEDLLLGIRIPVFEKRARRRMRKHPKFYFFDAGVYRTLRPSGPLDSPEEISGVALETLVMQEIRAVNDYKALRYTLYFWRTHDDKEVDFILYGSRGIVAIETKYSRKIDKRTLAGLRAFQKDYPESTCYLVYGGNERLYIDGIVILPIKAFFREVEEILSTGTSDLTPS